MVYYTAEEFENFDIVKETENSENSKDSVKTHNSKNLHSSLTTQIGGTHYKDCTIQPIEYIEANALAFLEGCVVKRITRHDKPTGKGRQDIEKAIHELQLLLELRYKEVATDVESKQIPKAYKNLGISSNIPLPEE